MKKCFLIFSLFIFVSSFSQTGQQIPRPKLVVGIMVDQMRWDFLYRYYDRYQAGGFKRMLNEGFSCENTFIDYIPTVTAVGHATVYTGSVPSIHGITGNSFILQATGRSVYCTEDSTVKGVGTTSAAGKMSPRNMLTTTITDELRLATNFRSKVIGIAMKDRGSILPAGHSANAAYWMDVTGNWITSSWYMNELPGWVNDFNNKKLPETYLKKDWNTLYPIKTYMQSTGDDSRYEGKFPGQEKPVFPVKTSGMMGNNVDVIRSTPYGNTYTLDMARAAIEGEKLGTRNVTDFLALSLSTPDHIGHRFGPNSIEIEDTYLRLDADFAGFFRYLDLKLGKGTYTVFLTADHGAAHNPAFLAEHKIPGFHPGGQLMQQLNAGLENRFGVKNLVTSFTNSQVHYNHTLFSDHKMDENAVREETVRILRSLPHVQFAADIRNLEEAALPLELEKRIRHGFNSQRSGPVVIITEPGYHGGSATYTGTGHGAWNPYDAHIPLVWMGWGINKGRSNKTVYMTDISATVAALLRIQMPNGSIGHCIEEVIKK